VLRTEPHGGGAGAAQGIASSHAAAPEQDCGASAVNLEALLLQGNGIGDDGMAQLALAVPRLPRLQMLRLDQNRIGAQGLESLTTALGEYVARSIGCAGTPLFLPRAPGVVSLWRTPLIRVRVEIMGSQKCGIVGKYQPVLMMINPIIFTRTRMWPACAQRARSQPKAPWLWGVCSCAATRWPTASYRRHQMWTFMRPGGDVWRCWGSALICHRRQACGSECRAFVFVTAITRWRHNYRHRLLNPTPYRYSTPCFHSVPGFRMSQGCTGMPSLPGTPSASCQKALRSCTNSVFLLKYLRSVCTRGHRAERLRCKS
jgi:hypothetical protein